MTILDDEIKYFHKSIINLILEKIYFMVLLKKIRLL
jgi:hypothetical protein